MDPMEGASGVEQALLRAAAANETPLSGSLELTPLCNMNCKMCYVRLSRAEQERLAPLRTAAEWCALGEEMQRAGTLFLLLTGGEPLLHPGFRDIYTHLRRLGMILSVNTNGTLIDEDWADFFAAGRPRRINITLYGADDRAYRDLCGFPGGFDRVIRAVKLLRARNVDVKLSCSLTRDNLPDLDRIHAIGRDLGVPVRADPYMLPATRERGRPFAEQARLLPEEAAEASVRSLRDEMGPELFRQFREKSLWEHKHIIPGPEEPGPMTCRAGSCSFSVNWQGELHPCVLLTSPAAPVFESGFAAGWQHLRDELRKVRISARCSACRLRPLCRVCAAACLFETGSYLGTPDYLCRCTEEVLRRLTAAGEEDRHD